MYKRQVLLGIWGALIPFVGPYFDVAYTPSGAWVWTQARGWLEVLPGVVAVVGGLLLIASRNRATAMIGGWLAVAAGAWFIVGRAFADVLAFGDIGAPDAPTPTKTVAVELVFFSGLGALIVFFGAMALGRVSVRSVRDAGYVRRRSAAVAERTEAEPVTASQPMPVVSGVSPDQPTEVIEREPRRHRSGLFRRRETPREVPLAH